MRASTGGRRLLGLVALVAAAALGLVACGGTAEEASEEAHAAQVEAIPGTDLSRVTLSEDAARRIDLQLAPVTAAAGAAGAVPYSALLYDPQGHTWVFVDEGAWAFVRAPITVAHIDHGMAVLTAGPPLGTRVVTVGNAELYGAEIGVGEE